MIYLQPHSGLANRIRAVISGLSFSDIVQQELTVIWKKEISLFCEFTDLFETDDKIIVKKKSNMARIINSVRSKPFLYGFFRRLFSIDFCLYDKGFEEFVWSTGTNNLNLSKLPKKVDNFYFNTCHEFSFDRRYFQYLRPVVTIRENIAKNVKMFTNKTIGVHIRRTDCSEAISESPLESFIEIMRTDLALDMDVNYFLATDDKEVEATLKELFPGKIIAYAKEFSRTTVKGMQDAMVDLYSLSATCKIYGSFYSSFSDIASRIGNIPLKVVLKSERI